MKILFIGGTGRLSTDVAKLSLEKGYEVYLLTRGSKERKKFIDEKYKMIYADIRNNAECKEKLNSEFFDVVIDFLTYDKTQLNNTLDIINGHYNQYVFISSATVYEKNTEEEIISEKTKVGNAKWDYAYKKYECEEELPKYFKGKKDLHYTIIRPYVTYNETRVPYPLVPQDSSMEYSIIYRILNNKKIPVIDNNIITTITNTKDFAVGVVGLFQNKEAYGEAFHITSDEEVKWQQVIDIIGEHYNKKIDKEYFSINEFSKKYPLYQPILNGDKGHQMRFNNDKIKKVVNGFDCKILLKDGVEEVINFYEDNKQFQKIDYYWYGRIDRICKDKKEKEFPNKNDKLKYSLGYHLVPTFMYKILRKARVIK